MRIVFMGTPDFAAAILESLMGSRHEVAAVVTQPDRPKGRGNNVQFPPVKELALASGIPVLQPEKLGDPGVFEALSDYRPDLIAVAAYGQFVPKQIRKLPRYGCINVHASLLPKYRGAAPIQWCVINGEKVSGVTTMYMTRGIDKGDMLLKREVELSPKETGDSLHDKLKVLGGPLLLETIDELEAGTAVRTPQNEEESCYAPMLEKSMGKLDFSLPADRLERLVRGLTSWPGAFTTLSGRTVKIWECDVCPEISGTPGTVVYTDRKKLIIACGEGSLSIKTIQPEGKKRMPVDDYLRGYPVEKGEVAG